MGVPGSLCSIKTLAIPENSTRVNVLVAKERRGEVGDYQWFPLYCCTAWQLIQNYENSPFSLATVAGMDTCRYMPASIYVFEVYDKASPLLVVLLPRKGGRFFFPVCAANNSRNSKSPPISLLPFPGSFPVGFDKNQPEVQLILQNIKTLA